MKTPTDVVPDPPSARERVLRAAMETFMELGYAEASTLKIATRARVSKRELYALFDNKQAMLAACIADRAGRVPLPARRPPPASREEFVAMLSTLGATILREVGDPGVMAVFRLAITESQRAPEVASTLETARQLVRKSVRDLVTQGQAAGLLATGDASEMAACYLALLWGDLMVSLLLRTREAPRVKEIDRRVGGAVRDFLRLYSNTEKLEGFLPAPASKPRRTPRERDR